MNEALFPQAVILIVKVLSMIALFIYSIFAVVIVRQERLMANVLEEQFEPVIRVFTYIHLAFSIGLLCLAFVIL